MTKKNKKEIVQMILNQKIDNKDKEEILEMLVDTNIAVDIDKEEEQNRTLGEKIASKISNIAGSWSFIFCFIFLLFLWIFINPAILKDSKIDPYPFILLNLFLSCLSAVQAPIIMMSQNKEAKKDSLRNKNDYKLDLKSELILEELHRKIELLINNQNRLLNILESEKD